MRTAVIQHKSVPSVRQSAAKTIHGIPVDARIVGQQFQIPRRIRILHRKHRIRRIRTNTHAATAIATIRRERRRIANGEIPTAIVQIRLLSADSGGGQRSRWQRVRRVAGTIEPKYV